MTLLDIIPRIYNSDADVIDSRHPLAVSRDQTLPVFASSQSSRLHPLVPSPLHPPLRTL